MKGEVARSNKLASQIYAYSLSGIEVPTILSTVTPVDLSGVGTLRPDCNVGDEIVVATIENSGKCSDATGRYGVQPRLESGGHLVLLRHVLFDCADDL